MHYSDQGETFPLDDGENGKVILELYSLMEPVCKLMRQAQNDQVPMAAKVHMALSRLKTQTCNVHEPLKVGMLLHIPQMCVVSSCLPRTS